MTAVAAHPAPVTATAPVGWTRPMSLGALVGPGRGRAVDEMRACESGGQGLTRRRVRPIGAGGPNR